MRDHSVDVKGRSVSVGDKIRVLEIDSRLLEFLPEDEKEDLRSFVAEVFEVEHINTDGSMLVSKTISESSDGVISGHDVAIFPNGAELVS